ncbi:hypothetical protein [Plantibacter sp. YIM 135249]|uniref:hypothetical protein n=1 Tax=Plantibacter sp. YIM 135249 TaxID=3423918 RepID=UPI003D34EB2C
MEGQRASLQRASAILQHQFARLVRDGLDEHGTTLKQYTSELGLDYRRMSRILCGEIVMKLEDVMLASRYLGFTLALERKEAARPDAPVSAAPASSRNRGIAGW